MKRLIYLNTFGWGTEHEMFNASLIYMCSRIGSGEVLFKATKSNYLSIEKLLINSFDRIPDNVKYKRVHTIGGNGRLSLLGRYLWGAILCWWHLLRSKKHDIIIIPFNNLFAIHIINYLNRKIKRKVVIFCHGEMEAIISNTNCRGILSKMLYYLCRSFFLNPNNNISGELYFTVLGDKIKENLKKNLPYNIWERFQVMDHPYLFSRNPIERHQNNQIHQLGTCGSMNSSKGIDQMIQFAQNCTASKMNISITHIGKVYEKCEQLIVSGVTVPSADRALSRKEFNDLIAKLDIILFFYPMSSYKITASGAIMDAIAMRKPIIALKNDYFEYVFYRFGEFGYLVDSITQMEETIFKICNKSLSITFDFDSIQRKFSPTALLKQLEMIIDKVTIEE